MHETLEFNKQLPRGSIFIANDYQCETELPILDKVKFQDYLPNSLMRKHQERKQGSISIRSKMAKFDSESMETNPK